MTPEEREAFCREYVEALAADDLPAVAVLDRALQEYVTADRVTLFTRIRALVTLAELDR